MKVSPCPPHTGAAFYLCDFCGRNAEFADEIVIAHPDTNGAACGKCIDWLAQTIAHARAKVADETDEGEERSREEVRPKPVKACITPPVRRQREAIIEQGIHEALVEKGFKAERQVRTQVGVADIVVAGSFVVEVKRSIVTWREFHQAEGQARAYAKALGIDRWYVVAQVVDESVTGDILFDEEGFIEFIGFEPMAEAA